MKRSLIKGSSSVHWVCRVNAVFKSGIRGKMVFIKNDHYLFLNNLILQSYFIHEHDFILIANG